MPETPQFTIMVRMQAAKTEPQTYHREVWTACFLKQGLKLNKVCNCLRPSKKTVHSCGKYFYSQQHRNRNPGLFGEEVTVSVKAASRTTAVSLSISCSTLDFLVLKTRP